MEVATRIRRYRTPQNLASGKQLVGKLYSEDNTRRLVVDGACEEGRDFYPVVATAHLCWIAGLAFLVPPKMQAHPLAFGGSAFGGLHDAFVVLRHKIHLGEVPLAKCRVRVDVML